MPGSIFDDGWPRTAGFFYMTCRLCGDFVSNVTLDNHVCDLEQVVKYQMSKLDLDIISYLMTPKGQFEIFYAERQRRAG